LADPAVVKWRVVAAVSDHAVAVGEDERLRSHHVHAMLAAPASAPGATVRRTAPHPSIPRVIIQFWDDPADVPADVRDCLDSWTPLLRRGFRRLLFNDASARRFIDHHFGREHVDAFDRCRHPAMRCDYFRLCYLVRRGGFYVDADEVYKGGDVEGLFEDARLKLQPLCWDAIREEMVPAASFTCCTHRMPGCTYYVNNNPIVAPPGHPVLRAALARSSRLLLDDAGASLGVQSTTGPGNLTACLVAHGVSAAATGSDPDFSFLIKWDDLSESRWPLAYRQDERNWRLWDPSR
jgi:mannosyltransferase OCH1-like enzyme